MNLYEKKDKPMVVFICLIFLAVGVYYFVSHLNSRASAKLECERRVIYNPASEREGALGKSKTDEHYVYMAKNFKTKQEALDYCLDTKDY